MDSLSQFNDVELKTTEFENSPSCSMDPKFSTSKPSVNEKTGQSFDSIFTQNQFLGVNSRLPLPTFWPNNVKLWFAFVETIFETYFVVSERERYNQLLAALKQDEISRVGHVILSSNIGCGPYSTSTLQI